MSHVNRIRPNILQDIQAASRGADLRWLSKDGFPLAKRYRQPPKAYPYSSKRQQGRYLRLVQR